MSVSSFFATKLEMFLLQNHGPSLWHPGPLAFRWHWGNDKQFDQGWFPRPLKNAQCRQPWGWRCQVSHSIWLAEIRSVKFNSHNSKSIINWITCHDCLTIWQKITLVMAMTRTMNMIKLCDITQFFAFLLERNKHQNNSRSHTTFENIQLLNYIYRFFSAKRV